MSDPHEYTEEEIKAAAENGTILFDNSRIDPDRCGAWVIHERTYPNRANTAYPARHQRSAAALVSRFDHKKDCHVYSISFGAKYPSKYRLRKASIRVVFSNREADDVKSSAKPVPEQGGAPEPETNLPFVGAGAIARFLVKRNFETDAERSERLARGHREDAERRIEAAAPAIRAQERERIRARVESAGQYPEDKQINDAIIAAADIIHATAGNFGEFGEEIPATAKEAIEAFLAALEPVTERGSPEVCPDCNGTKIRAIETEIEELPFFAECDSCESFQEATMSESGEDARLRRCLEVSKAFDTAEGQERVAAIRQQERIVARINATRRYNGSLNLPEAEEHNRTYNRAIDDCLAAIRSEADDE